MKRGWRINKKPSLIILSAAIFFLLIAVSLSQESFANSYYYTQTEDGTYYYTNIKPDSKDYKSLNSPWGVLKTAPRKSGVNKDGKFKYSKRYDRHIESTASWYGVDPLLVKAIIKVESNFNPRAVSPKGAMGMMQLMPDTARKNGVKDPFDAQENIEGGVRYFSQLMKMFDQRLTLALAGYNAGENAVIKYGNKIPPYPETIDYVEKVYIHYDILKKQKVNRNIHSMVAERFDKKKVQYKVASKSPGTTEKNKTNKSSFIYVETLESSSIVKNTPKPQKPKIVSKPTRIADSTAPKSPSVYADQNFESPVAASVSEKGAYTVQIASFPSQVMAQKMEKNLKEKTYPAYVQKTDIPGKGTWYRVRVGSFKTKEEAKSYGESIREKESSVNSIFIASK